MKIRFLLVFLFFAFIANGQKIITNKHYIKPEKVDLIVFTPYFLDNVANKNVNDVFCETFGKSFEIVYTSLIINNILTNSKFNEIIGKTAYKKFETNELKSNPNLYANLTPTEIEIYKEKTLKSDIIIISSAINSRKVYKVRGRRNVTVYGNIAVFDLRTGEFIIYISDKIKAKFEDSSYDEYLLIKPLFESLFNELKENLK